MTLEDPFYVVKDEVFKALNKTRGLYLRWQEVSAGPAAPPQPCPEAEWTSTELKNALRSIQWDLEDLEDTISIVEKYPSKFKLDNKEISDRRRFIYNIKSEVKMMKSHLSMRGGRDALESPREALPLLRAESPAEGELSTPLISSWDGFGRSAPRGYSDCPTEVREEGGGGGGAQQRLLAAQDEQLAAIARSASNLNSVSRHITRELDDHVLMLEDINAEIENVESKLDSSLRQVARVLRVNNNRRQWIIIGCLAGLVFLVLILFIIL